VIGAEARVPSFDAAFSQTAMTEKSTRKGAFFMSVTDRHRSYLPARCRILYNTGRLQRGASLAVARGLRPNPVIRAVVPSLLSRKTRPLMKFFVWLIRVLVFVLLLVLALANTQTATLNFLAGYSWTAPLILIGLAFFVVGLLAGLLSSLPTVFRLRMENGRLKRDLRVVREAPVVVPDPPMPPLI
jgi:lipopolysaccharide assembly protein A